MTKKKYLRIAIALFAAATICSCTPVDVPNPSIPSGDGSVVLPLDTTSNGGGKDNINRDSLSSGGSKDNVTLPGFSNPTPNPILKPNFPNNEPDLEDQINVNLLGEWRGVAYATEMRTEQTVQRVDSVGFSVDNFIEFRFNADASYVITRPQRMVEGVWQDINGQLFIVYDTDNGWSETYVFNIAYNDSETVVLELSESQIIGATTPQKVYVLWLTRKQ